MKTHDDVLSAATRSLAELLRDAINERGVTLSWLQAQLSARGNSVSLATLSYWRSGARRPEGAQSMAALEDLEHLLHLEPLALQSLVGPSHRTGPLGPNQFPLDEETLERAVIAAFEAMDTPYPDLSREVTTQSVTEVGPDGAVVSTTTRSVVQGAVGTISGLPFLQLSPGVPTPAPKFRVSGGGRIGKLYSHPDQEVHGFLIELDHPLTAPETTLIEWSAELAPGSPVLHESGHALARTCRELLMWVRFHPDAIPDWCEAVEETADGQVVTPLPLEGRKSVHVARRAFGPGTLQVRWGFGAQGEDAGSADAAR